MKAFPQRKSVLIQPDMPDGGAGRRGNTIFSNIRIHVQTIPQWIGFIELFPPRRTCLRYKGLQPFRCPKIGCGSPKKPFLSVFVGWATDFPNPETAFTLLVIDCSTDRCRLCVILKGPPVFKTVSTCAPENQRQWFRSVIRAESILWRIKGCI